MKVQQSNEKIKSENKSLINEYDLTAGVIDDFKNYWSSWGDQTEN